MRRKGFGLTEILSCVAVIGCIAALSICLFVFKGAELNSFEAKQNKLSAALKAAALSIVSDENLVASKACDATYIRDRFSEKIANAQIVNAGISVNGNELPALKIKDYGVLAFETSSNCELKWHAHAAGGAIYNTDTPVVIYSNLDGATEDIIVPSNVTPNSTPNLTSLYSDNTLAFSMNDNGIENIYSSGYSPVIAAGIPQEKASAPPVNSISDCWNGSNYSYTSSCLDENGNHVDVPFYMLLNDNTRPGASCVPAYCPGNGMFNGQLITSGKVNNACADEMGNVSQCICPHGKPYWAEQYIYSDEIAGICLETCQEIGMIENPDILGTCICPEGTEWDNSLKQCIDPYACPHDYLKFDTSTSSCICKTEAELIEMDSQYFQVCEIYDSTKLNDGCKRLRENWEMTDDICICPVPFSRAGNICSCENPRTLTNGICACDRSKVQLASNEIFVNDNNNPDCKTACDTTQGYIPNPAKTECIKCPNGYEPNPAGDTCVLICESVNIGGVTVTRTAVGDACVCKNWTEFTAAERTLLANELRARKAVYNQNTNTCTAQCLADNVSYLCPSPAYGVDVVVCGDECHGATAWNCQNSACACVPESQAGSINPNEFKLYFGEKHAWDEIYPYSAFCKTCVEPRIYDGVSHPLSANDNIGCVCPQISYSKMQQLLTGNYVYDTSKENCTSLCPQNMYAQLPLHDVCLPCDVTVADVVNNQNVYSCQCNRTKTEQYIANAGMNAIFVDDISVGCIEECPQGLVARNGVCVCPLSNTTLINGVCQCRPDNDYYKAEVDAIKATLNPVNKEYYDANATANNCISICNKVNHSYNYNQKTCDCTSPRSGDNCTCPIITSTAMQQMLTGNYVYDQTKPDCRSICPADTYAKLPLHDVCLPCDSRVADVVNNQNVYSCQCNRTKTEQYIANAGMNAIFVDDISVGCIEECPQGLVARNGVCVCPLFNTTLINGVCQCRPDNDYYKAEVDAIKATLNPVNKEYYDANATANNCISICNKVNHSYNYNQKTCDCTSPRSGDNCTCPIITSTAMQQMLTGNYIYDQTKPDCRSICPAGTYAQLPLHDLCLVCDATVADVVEHNNIYVCQCNRTKTEQFIITHSLNAIFVDDISTGCIESCPPGLVARNGVCSCPLTNMALINGVCQCRPDNAYYKAEVDAIKATLDINKKEYYDENAGANNCISICDMQNYQYNPYDKSCSCATPRLEPGCVCPSGNELYYGGLLSDAQYRNPENIHCVSDCKVGQKHNKVTAIGYDGQIHAPFETCLCEYPFIQSAAGGDSCECDYPWTISSTGLTCECKEPFIIKNVDGVERCDCPSPRYRSGRKCVCPQQEYMNIPQGYIYNTDAPECVTQCDATKFNIPNRGKNQCICDPNHAAYFYDTADNCGCPAGTTRTQVELLSFNQVDFERNVYVCECQKQCGPNDVPMMVNGTCQCVFDPLIVDYDTDNEIESTLNCGVDITGDGNIHLCANHGDKMLAFSELNSGNEIDATKIFSTETINPFNGSEKFGSTNGFEALYELAMAAMIYADENDINVQIITEDGFVELPVLKYVLNQIGWDLGFISDDNITDLEDLGHVFAISTDYYSQDDKGTALQKRETGFYKSIDGTLHKAADVWVKLFAFLKNIA